MPMMLQPLRQLTRQMRVHGPALLSGAPEPHDELMSLIWGPRFDREHALGLIARQPAIAAAVLPWLVSAADTFDALHFPAQRRLRELVCRHRALSAASPVDGDECVDGGAASVLQPRVAGGTSPLGWSMAEKPGPHWSRGQGTPYAPLVAGPSQPM